MTHSFQTCLEPAKPKPFYVRKEVAMNAHGKLLCLLVLAAAISTGQGNRGTLTGSVSDATGSLIPGAKVTARHTATNQTAETETTAAGQYTLPNLAPGAYEVTFTAGGFRTLLKQQIELRAAESVRVDAQMEIGSQTESISVTAEVPRVQTDTPDVGTTLGSKELLDLPLNFGGARVPETFAFKITPGVSGTSGDTHVNGSVSASKEIIVDGASATSNRAGSYHENSISVEAVQEFRVQTSGLSAEYGRMQAGVFNFILRSGENDLHGSAFGALRNEALNANTFPNNARGIPRQQDRRQTFAGGLGGPVVIPKLYDGRNRTFFYTVYERYRERNFGITAPTRTAPVPEFYEGDFSRLLGPALPQTDALGRPVLRGAIFDPATFRQLPNGRWVGEMFPGNRIPVNRFSEVSKRVNEIAKRHYLPTVRDAAGQIPLVANMQAPASNNPVLDQHQFSVKGDQTVTDKHKVAVSYIYTERPRVTYDAIAGLFDLNDPVNGGPFSRALVQNITSHLGRTTYDWLISPRLLNHAVVFINRFANPFGTPQADVNGAELIGLRGMDVAGYPTIGWGGGPFVTLANPASRAPALAATTVWGLLNTTSLTQGRHYIRMGVDARGYISNQRTRGFGDINFNARATAIPNEPFSGNQTGYAFASYLLGIVDSANINEPFTVGFRRKYYALFFQDDFRVAKNLTLNLGMRWEYQPPLYEVNDKLASWSPSEIDPQSGLPGAYQFAGNCRECTGRRYFGQKFYGGFAPRIGFAWQPAEKWAVRGGYGIMYSSEGVGISHQARAYNFPWVGTWGLGADNVNPWRGIFNWDDGIPQDRYIPAALNRSWGATNRPAMIDPGYGLPPYTQQWNINVQRQLGGKTLVDVGYLGNKGTRLAAGRLANVNQLPPSVLTDFGARLTNPVRNAAEAAANGIPYPYPGFRGTVASALRPFPQVLGNQTVQVYGSPLGFMHHQSLQATVNRQFTSGFTAYANYVWSKTLSNVESAAENDNSGPLDYYNLKLEKSLADYDVPHMVKAYMNYELPFGRGKAFGGSSGKFVNTLIGGWNVAAIVNYFSGTPLGFGASNPFPSAWNGAASRANVAPGALRLDSFDPKAFDILNLNNPANRILNTSLVTDIAPLTLGNSAPVYGQFRTFGVRNEDITLQKNTRIREKYRFQIRAEFLNAFNRAIRGGFRTSPTDPLFGQVTTANGSRVIQIGTRLDF
jgi:hypothetical protein